MGPQLVPRLAEARATVQSFMCYAIQKGLQKVAEVIG